MMSQKKRSTALALCFLLGCLGGHRFYLKKYATGVLQLLTLGGAGIWAVIDFIFIACGAFTDNEGKAIRQWR
jgi:TM2 domain-containing membrane protein YozV